MLAIFLLLLIALILIGIPVATATGLTSLAVLAVGRGIFDIPTEMVAQRVLYGVSSFPLLAIPFFLLAGRLMNTAGITDRIFGFANTLVGHVTGGLGHVNIVASMLFAGMSGSAVSDAVGLGTIEMKAMLKEGYDRDFSASITAASSCIGPIIPPSIPMVLYGVLGGVSVGGLFIGAFIPGILMGLSLMVIVYFFARRRGYPRRQRPPIKEFFISAKGAFLPLMTPTILIGGIWSGIFTPTEAAVVAVLYSLFLGLVVYREVKLKDLPEIFYKAMEDTAIIMFIVAAASLYGWLLIRYRIPIILAEDLTTLTTNPLLILLLLNGFLLIVGCFMETTAAINILTPILVPLVVSVGIDPLHFGVVMVLNLMIGLLTPPVGMVLYSMTRVAELPYERLQRAILPFLIPLFVVLFLITVFPQIVLFLPNLVFN